MGSDAGREAWGTSRRFEALLERCERLRPERLGFDELRELARLYRRATAQLARLRERGDDPEAVRSLNALCVRAYGHLAVASPRAGDAPRLAQRVRAALGRTWRAQLAAWALLAVGVYVGAALVARDPRAAHALVPASLGYSAGGIDRLLQDPAARAEFLAPSATPPLRNLAFGSALFAHNTRVAMLSLAAGILAVPTIVLTVYNGVVLGAFAAVFLRPPHPVEFLAWILPHGIPELTAIVLCSAGGLLLGAALLAPGRRGRAVALREASESALLLLAAAVPLLFAAAGVESFVRESALGVGARLAVAGAWGAALLGFTLLARRAHEPTARWLHELPAGDPAPGGERGAAASVPQRPGP